MRGSKTCTSTIGQSHSTIHHDDVRGQDGGAPSIEHTPRNRSVQVPENNRDETSPVQKARKFSAVRGTRCAKSSMVIRPSCSMLPDLPPPSVRQRCHVPLAPLAPDHRPTCASLPAQTRTSTRIGERETGKKDRSRARIATSRKTTGFDSLRMSPSQGGGHRCA